MSNQIEYIFGEPTLRSNKDAVIFPIGYADAIYKCVVKSELLKNCFNASPSNLLESYKNNKPQINEIAKKLLNSGNITPNNEVLITTEVFRNYSPV